MLDIFLLRDRDDWRQKMKRQAADLKWLSNALQSAENIIVVVVAVAVVVRQQLVTSLARSVVFIAGGKAARNSAQFIDTQSIDRSVGNCQVRQALRDGAGLRYRVAVVTRCETPRIVAIEIK